MDRRNFIKGIVSASVIFGLSRVYTALTQTRQYRLIDLESRNAEYQANLETIRLNRETYIELLDAKLNELLAERYVKWGEVFKVIERRMDITELT